MRPNQSSFYFSTNIFMIQQIYTYFKLEIGDPTKAIYIAAIMEIPGNIN